MTSQSIDPNNLMPMQELVRGQYRELLNEGYGPLEAIHLMEDSFDVDDPRMDTVMNHQFRDWLLGS